jgi:hypothetical protein
MKGKEVYNIDLKELVKEATMPRIRSVCTNKENDTLLVGTFGSEIYELISEG